MGGGIAGEVGFLRQIADGGAGLGERLAAIGLHQPGGDLEQGGFARTVAAHQAQPLARAHAQFRPVQQQGVAEADMDIFQEQQRRHAGLVLCPAPPIKLKMI